MSREATASAVLQIESVVTINDLTRPIKKIACSLSSGLAGDPEFQILDSVVVTDPVLVMDVFSGEEEAPKVLLYDQDVLPNHIPITRSGVVVRSDANVPVFAGEFPPLPIGAFGSFLDGPIGARSTEGGPVVHGFVTNWARLLHPGKLTGRASGGVIGGLEGLPAFADSMLGRVSEMTLFAYRTTQVVPGRLFFALPADSHDHTVAEGAT